MPGEIKQYFIYIIVINYAKPLKITIFYTLQATAFREKECLVPWQIWRFDNLTLVRRRSNMAWAKRKFDTRSATLKYAAKISATLKYWANWKFDTRSATLKYGLSEAKIWHTFGDAQIWQRFPNMTTLTKYVNAYEICQRLRNMSTLTKYVNAYKIWQRLQNMTSTSKSTSKYYMTYFISVDIFHKRWHIS